MRKYLAEFLGTGFLLTAIVGSGIMAMNLTEDSGLRLLINAASTALALFVLINVFADTSGAHFNPVVTIYARIERKLSNTEVLSYLASQLLGGICGVFLAHTIFAKSLLVISQTNRNGIGQFFGELIATLGLLLVVALKADRAAIIIPAWIGTAFFFTSSTAFANPAVTVSRIFTDTATGIAPTSMITFLIAQFLSLVIAIPLSRFLQRKN